MDNNQFLGTGWSFPPEFFDGGETVAMVSGEEDIRQSLQILLSTSLKERALNSQYGTDLKRYSFESLTQGVLNSIEDVISRAILNNETRILVNEIQLDNSESEKGLVKIIIEYTVQQTNNRFNLVYPFYINESIS
ncbi:MAG: GPW/gp25 family protein [Cyclobacteriaceae bacterium]